MLTLKVAIRMLNVRRGFVSITSSCWTTWTQCSPGLSATSTSSMCSTRRSGTTSELSERLPSRTNVFFPFLDESRQRRSSSSMTRLIGLRKVTSGAPSVEIYLQVKTVTRNRPNPFSTFLYLKFRYHYTNFNLNFNGRVFILQWYNGMM